MAVKAADALLSGTDAPVQDVAAQLLGADQVVGKTNAQLTDQIRPLIEQNVRSVIASPAFAALWKSSNQEIHSQLISQLNSNSQTITLNFHALITGTINQLATTKLGISADKLQLADNVGVVTLQGNQLQTIRRAYTYFKEATIAIVATTLISLVLAVVIAVHHLKTLRQIALSTGIVAGVFAVLLSMTSYIKISGTDPVQQKMAVALINTITHQLRISLIVIAATCFAVVIATKVYSVVQTRKSASKKTKVG